MRLPDHNEEGTALIEFVGLAVVLLLPLIYLLLSVFCVQRAAFAVTQAAREAGRAYATAPTSTVAGQRAAYAADLALTGSGLRAGAAVSYGPSGGSCGAGTSAPSLAPGSRFVVCVRGEGPLPLGGSVAVKGRYTVSVDRYRADRR